MFAYGNWIAAPQPPPPPPTAEEIAAAAALAALEYNRNCMWCTPKSVGASMCHCKVPCGAECCDSADSKAFRGDPADRVFSVLVPLVPVPVFRAA